MTMTKTIDTIDTIEAIANLMTPGQELGTMSGPLNRENWTGKSFAYCVQGCAGNKLRVKIYEKPAGNVKPIATYTLHITETHNLDTDSPVVDLTIVDEDGDQIGRAFYWCWTNRGRGEWWLTLGEGELTTDLAKSLGVYFFNH